MKCPIGYNVREQIPDTRKLKNHLERLGGVKMLLVHTRWAHNLPQWMPYTDMLIWRIHDDTFRQMSAIWPSGREFIQHQVNLLIDNGINPEDSNVWLVGPNEPEYSEDFINWERQGIEYAAERGYKYLAGSFSVGNPPGIEKADTLDKYKATLQILGEHDNLGLALHEYFPAIWTRGINWYGGRFRWWIDYCKKHHLKMPRLVITESGCDFIDDDKDFLSSIIPGMERPRGYHQVDPYWARITPNYPGKSIFYANQYLDQYEHLYMGFADVALYTWGYWSGWEDMDVSGDLILQQVIEHWWSESKSRLENVKADKVAIVKGTNIGVYARPDASSTRVHSLNSGALIRYGGPYNNHWYIESDKMRGYVRTGEIELVDEEPVIVPPEERPTQPVPVVPVKPNWAAGLTLEEVKMIAASRYYAQDPTYPEPSGSYKRLVARLADLLDQIA